MSLNLISNYAANVAQRNLTTVDMDRNASLAKLSSGTRVVSAKDDAASLAIGSRLSAEVQALKQATVNAGQASSMLQIADGAMGKVGDILTRMKTLAVQAASGQLGSTERGMLNTEYQADLSEITRISQATTFNGQQLVNGGTTTSTSFNSQPAANQQIGPNKGFSEVKFGSNAAAGTYSYSYDNTSNVLTMTNLATGQKQGVNIGATAIGVNATQTVRFDQLDTTVTLNSAFSKTTLIGNTAAVDFTAASAGAGTVQDGTVKLETVSGTGVNLQALTGATANQVLISGAAAATSTLTLGTGANRFEATGVDLTTVGEKTVTLTGLGTSAGTNLTFKFVVSTAFTNAATAAGDGHINVDELGTTAFASSTASNTLSLSFKIGTGTTAGVDSVTVSLDSINAASLGIAGTDLTTATNADTASTSISSAIDKLNTARANIGSSQNRLDFASANLATTIENQESARSSLLDLDVATEMTRFTSKQVLEQAGVAMLAQANQIPQQLLRLLQQ